VQSDTVENDERWMLSLREELQQADVELRSQLCETTVSLEEIKNLEAGDVIPIDIPDLVSICVNEIPIMRGNFGVSNGKNAVKVVERIKTKGGNALSVIPGGVV